MIRVAFWYDRPFEYSGGLNYLKNLIFAISSLDDRRIEPIVFLGRKADSDILRLFEPYAKVVQTALLDRKSMPWYFHKVLFKLTGSLFFVDRLMKMQGVRVISHADDIYGKSPCKIINWVPDFQYLHLPNLFPGLDSGACTARLVKTIAHTDVTVLSSYEALNDFNKIAPSAFKGKARVLQFVSQPNEKTYERTEEKFRDTIEKKYGFKGKFFFLPNQFWAHKNHAVVFEAVRLLKESGREVLVICTGNIRDYRVSNQAYTDSLLEFITVHKLSDNIKVLGLIDYDDVLFMMRNSVAVINPSLFEGWSTSVEEAKSIGKKILLSNIKVHLEQNPPQGVYFNPDDPVMLSQLLIEVWETSAGGPDNQLEINAKQNLKHRTIEYSRNYQNIVLGLL